MHSVWIDCIRNAIGLLWEEMTAKKFSDEFQNQFFFPRMFCSGHIKHAKCNAGLFQKDFTCTELLLLCSRLGLLITLVKEGGSIMCVCT